MINIRESSGGGASLDPKLLVEMLEGRFKNLKTRPIFDRKSFISMVEKMDAEQLPVWLPT